MITKDEIQELLHSTETYRVERTTSTGDMDKFQEAICAFANDLPNSRKKGYLILGAYDNGTLSGLKVTDDLLKKIAAIRSNGNILPIPVMSVDCFQFPEGDLLMAEVSPSDLPPVRYRGRTFIRIGPRRDIATEAEERILSERRMSFMATFDTMPCLAAKLNDINMDLLRTKYLIPLLGNELVDSDTRPIEEQMAAVGMYDTEHQCPTYAAVVLFGYKPRRFMPGLYVQYVRFKGEDVTSEVENEMQLEGNYCELLPRLESLLELSVIKKKPVFVSILREEMVSNYPYQAIRELLLNACMHRDMQSNTPLRFYEFASHLEILNAGGLYGNARPENFPSVNDYRNPLVASAMKTLGYVNMFNRGVGQVQTDLKENGNQPAEFNVNLITAFKVEVKVSQSYTNENDDKTGGKVGGDVPSLSQALSLVLSPVCPQLSEVQLKKMVSVIDYLFRASGSITELMDCAGEKNKSRFRQTILKPLVDTGLVEPTIKDVPNSPKQKYALTDNGREKLQAQYHGYIFRYSNTPLSKEELTAARENYAYRETSKVTS